MNKIFTLTILTLVLITGTIFTVNYPNISNNIIDENLGTTPPLQPTQGGTGTSTAPTFGQLLVGNASGKYTLTSTSSLGISGSGTVTSVDMSVPTGLTISGNPITTSGTLALTLTGGYEIPTTASTSDWSNNVSSQWVTSGSNIYYSTGNVGIGSTSPLQELTVEGDAIITNSLMVGSSTETFGYAGVTYSPKMIVENEGIPTNLNYVSSYFGNNNTQADQPVYVTARGRGTQSSKSIVQDNDYLGEMIWAGYNGVDWSLSGRLFMEVDGTPGNNDMPSAMVFQTTPDASETPAERMRITSTGYVGIGSTSPYYMLDVAGNIGSSGDIYADNINYNEGMLNEPTIADADGVNISITEGEALLRSDSTWDGDKRLYYKTITATTSLAVFDNDINYIYAYWNSGTPIYGTTQDRDILNNSNYIPVARVYMSSGNIEYQMSYQYLGRSSAIRNFDRVMRIRGSAGIEKESGLAISETATRVINLTSGYAWFGMSRKSIDALVQNATNTHIWYHSSGNWTSSATTTYNNTYYDNGTDIVALTTNRYAVNWIYRNLQTAEIDIVMGTGDYKLAQAEASTVPTPPTAVSNFYVLTGRIIVQKAADTATAIENVSTTAFNQAAVTSHSDLSNLNWSSAGHTFDTAFSTGAYNILTSGTVLATSTQFINASTTNLTVSTNSYLGTIVSGTWNGTAIGVGYGGTGITSTPSLGQILVGNGTNYTLTATSALGLVTSVNMTVPTGLSVSGNPITTSGTLALTFTGGYSIPLTASTTNGQTAYNWGNHASAGYMTLSVWFATSSAPQLTSLANLATIGTITTGVWHGTAIDISDYTNLAAGRSLTLSGDSIEADAELYTANFDFVISTSTISTTTGVIAKKLPLAFTITEVSGYCKGGTTTIMIDERAATTPKTAGTDIFNQAIAFGDYVATTTFANASIASGAYVNLDIDGYFSGTPSWCSVSIKGTKDD